MGVRFKPEGGLEGSLDECVGLKLKRLVSCGLFTLIYNLTLNIVFIFLHKYIQHPRHPLVHNIHHHVRQVDVQCWKVVVSI